MLLGATSGSGGFRGSGRNAHYGVSTDTFKQRAAYLRGSEQSQAVERGGALSSTSSVVTRPAEKADPNLLGTPSLNISELPEHKLGEVKS